MKGFSSTVVASIRDGKILGIRAGKEHRFLGIWAVVVKGRIFVRPWNNKAGGWYRAFLKDPHGTIQISSGREIAVRAKRTRGERFMDAVDLAYGEKYHTPGSRKYVRGFALSRRRATTLELIPR